MPDKIMKDGKPSTSFSRQDREWVKAMVGGSGSSDFSTAKVTVKNMTARPKAINNVIMISGYPPERYFSYDSEFYIPAEETTVFDIPMIDGYAGFDATEEGVTITTSDNISYSDGVFGITGDGTITFSPVS